VAVAGEQAHALAVTLGEQVATIVLDLVYQSVECRVQSRIGHAVNISDDAKTVRAMIAFKARS
jgi:hypothetical protein